MIAITKVVREKYVTVVSIGVANQFCFVAASDDPGQDIEVDDSHSPTKPAAK